MVSPTQTQNVNPLNVQFESINKSSNVSVDDNKIEHEIPKKSLELKVENNVNIFSDKNKIKGKKVDLSYSRLKDRANLSIGQKISRAFRNLFLAIAGKAKLPSLDAATSKYSLCMNNSLFPKPINYYATLNFSSDKQGIYDAVVNVQKEITRHNDRAKGDYGKPFVMNLYNYSDNKEFSIMVSGETYCIFNTNTEPGTQWMTDFHSTLDKYLKLHNENMEGSSLTYRSPEFDKATGTFEIYDKPEGTPLEKNSTSEFNRSKLGIPKSSGYFGAGLYEYLSSNFSKADLKSCSATEFVKRFVKDLEGLPNESYKDYMREVGEKVLSYHK